MIASDQASTGVIDGAEMLSLWIALGGILAAVLFGALLIVFVRRWYRRKAGNVDGGFTLQELRSMQRQGELSQEEFDNMRNVLLGSMAEKADEPTIRNSPKVDDR